MILRKANTVESNEKMKLSEALSLRKDLQTRISQLESRLQSNVTVQEGEEPMEEPKELFAELKACVKQLEYYIFQINVTNMQVTADDGRPMTRLLVEREALGTHISLLRKTLETASGKNIRYGRCEIKTVSTIDVKALRKQVDNLSQQYRLLDMQIQTLNFKYDLVE